MINDFFFYALLEDGSHNEAHTMYYLTTLPLVCQCRTVIRDLEFEVS
jgi:hypothetical protein